MTHNDTDAYQTDDSTRRTVLKSAGGLAAIGTLPGVATAADPVPDTVPAEQLRRAHALKNSVTAHTYVDLPREAYNLGVERAKTYGEAGRLTPYLLDYVNLQFGFVVDGAVAHMSEGFDADSVVVVAEPDGNVPGTVYGHPGE